MRLSVILGHPYKESFNHAIAETVVKTLEQLGHDVIFHDLYDENFDSHITGYELVNCLSDDDLVEAHCAEIKEADGIIIVHPNWWGQPPAILKGWVDRVLRNGLAYGFDDDDKGGGVPNGLLKAKTAVVFNTSNTPADRELEVFGDPLETIWKNCIFAFCGVHDFHRRMFRVIADSTYEQRCGWLDEVSEILSSLFT